MVLFFLKSGPLSRAGLVGMRDQARLGARIVKMRAGPCVHARQFRTDYVVVSPHYLREPSGLARHSALEGHNFIGPLGALPQGVRIPCIIMAISSGFSSHLKVALKSPVKPQALRACFAINQFSLSSPGGCAPRPPFTLREPAGRSPMARFSVVYQKSQAKSLHSHSIS